MTDYLSGSYLLTFKQVAVEPNFSPVATCDQFTLWQTDLGFIASTRVQKARYRACKLSFPYMPGKVGRPDGSRSLKTYFCAFDDIKPKKEYATWDLHVFLFSVVHSTPAGKACRLLCASMRRSKALTDKTKVIEFWRPFDREIYSELSKQAQNGAFGSFNGHFYVIRKDGRKYKYVKACTSQEFAQMYGLALAYPSKRYFALFVDECSILQTQIGVQ